MIHMKYLKFSRSISVTIALQGTPVNEILAGDRLELGFHAQEGELAIAADSAQGGVRIIGPFPAPVVTLCWGLEYGRRIEEAE